MIPDSGIIIVSAAPLTGSGVFRLGLLLIAALPFLAPAPAFAASRCRAIDGDTIRCARERIRLRDVYAAERGSPGAETARRALQRKLDSGEVRIRRHGRDRYGRTLGDVTVNGRGVTQSDIGPRGGRGADRVTRTHRRTPRSGALQR